MLLPFLTSWFYPPCNNAFVSGGTNVLRCPFCSPNPPFGYHLPLSYQSPVFLVSCVPNNRRMDKGIVAHMCHEMLLSHKEQICVVLREAEATVGHHLKWITTLPWHTLFHLGSYTVMVCKVMHVHIWQESGSKTDWGAKGTKRSGTSDNERWVWEGALKVHGKPVCKCLHETHSVQRVQSNKLRQKKKKKLSDSRYYLECVGIHLPRRHGLVPFHAATTRSLYWKYGIRNGITWIVLQSCLVCCSIWIWLWCQAG